MKKYIALVFAAVASLFASPVKAQTFCNPDWLGPDYSSGDCVTYPTITGAPPEWCRPWQFLNTLSIPSKESLSNYCLLTGIPESRKSECYDIYCVRRNDAIMDYWNCVYSIPANKRIYAQWPPDSKFYVPPCNMYGWWWKCSDLVACQAALLNKLADLKAEFCDCLIATTMSPEVTLTNLEKEDDGLFYLLP